MSPTLASALRLSSPLKRSQSRSISRRRNKSSCTVYATPVSDFLEAAVNKTDVPTASRGEQPPPQQDNVDVILAGARTS